MDVWFFWTWVKFMLILWLLKADCLDDLLLFGVKIGAEVGISTVIAYLGWWTSIYYYGLWVQYKPSNLSIRFHIFPYITSMNPSRFPRVAAAGLDASKLQAAAGASLGESELIQQGDRIIGHQRSSEVIRGHDWWDRSMSIDCHSFQGPKKSRHPSSFLQPVGHDGCKVKEIPPPLRRNGM